MTTYVLLHDAFQGGWAWSRVAEILRRKRHEVYSPTLTGCGDRSHLLNQNVDLHTYVTDITNFVHFESLSRAVFVCHGYAGMVMSAVIQAMPHVVEKAIYLDAVIPAQGKSFLDLSGEWFGYFLRSHLHDGWLVKPSIVTNDAIARQTDRQWYESRLTSFPQAAFTAPFPGRFDSTLFDISFIHCSRGDDPANQNVASAAKRRKWPCHELNCGHLPMVTAPGELAGLLDTIGNKALSFRPR